MQTAVALLIYRRPDLTRRVFAEIAKARPSRLLVVADGPRDAAERERCEAARDIVARVDWPCDVRRDYANGNLGCRKRVSSGLNWVFEQVEEAIILEDDCVPHPTFFPFCEELLAKYRHDPRIGHVGGTDHNRGAPRGDSSYYFSRYTSIWGWATWKRCWQSYDVELRDWPAVKAAGRHLKWFGSPEEARHFESVWDDIHAGRIDTWDAQWLFCRLAAGSLAITPNGNLITNIGFRADASHTHDSAHPFAELQGQGLTLPLRHPAQVVPDTEADRRRADEEFLRKVPATQRLKGALGNKHFYGKLLRKVPVVGSAWAAWRRGRSEEI